MVQKVWLKLRETEERVWEQISAPKDSEGQRPQRLYWKEHGWRRKGKVEETCLGLRKAETGESRNLQREP